MTTINTIKYTTHLWVACKTNVHIVKAIHNLSTIVFRLTPFFFNPSLSAVWNVHHVHESTIMCWYQRIKLPADNFWMEFSRKEDTYAIFILNKKVLLRETARGLPPAA